MCALVARFQFSGTKGSNPNEAASSKKYFCRFTMLRQYPFGFPANGRFVISSILEALRKISFLFFREGVSANTLKGQFRKGILKKGLH